MLSKYTLFRLLKGDVHEAFPTAAIESGDPQWRAFADILNQYRDEWVQNGNEDGSLSIEHLDDIFKCEKIPSLDLTYYVANMLNARYSPGDTERAIKQAICSAMANNRIHATVENIKDVIEICTGVRPLILSTSGYSGGWDADSSITDPPFQADFQGGLLWDADDGYVGILTPLPWNWNSVQTGILVDLQSSGLTHEQLACAILIVAELKDAGLTADVGFYDGSGLVLLASVIRYAGTRVYSGDTTTGSPIIQNLSGVSGLEPGMIVQGPGVGASAIIDSIDSDTQVTLDVNSVSDQSGATITFQYPINTEVDPGA